MIRCKDVCVEYPSADGKTIFALKNISLEINDSEFVCIIGPNGSGKSTLALALTGLRQVSSGTIVIDQKDINTLLKTREIRDLTGIVFQNPDNQLLTNVLEHELAFALENRSVDKEEMIKQVNKTICDFQMQDLKGYSPNQLSGGQKQKLAIASVMITMPKYLFLDESTSYLDSEDRKMITDLLTGGFKNRKKDGFSIVLITQFSYEALFCDRLIVLNEGELILDDSPDKVFTKNQSVLEKIGIEVPLRYQLKNAVPSLKISKGMLN
ncbi:ATP-binding cassette domain-containing protein [candidate division KSB1 bacterium]